MASAKRVTVGWRRPATDEDFRVTLNVTPGTPDRGPDFGCAGGYPGDPPDLQVVEVCEDAPGGAVRDDLLAEVEADLDSLEGDALEAANEYDECGGYDTLEEARGER